MKSNTRLLIKLNVVADIFLIFVAFFAVSTFAQSCTLKGQGDANCDGKVDLVDYESWRREFLAVATTKTSDFNNDTRVDLVDYESWRRGFINGPGNPPITATPTVVPTTAPTVPPVATATPTPPTGGGLPYTPPAGFPAITSQGTYLSTLGVPRSLLPYRNSTTILWNKPLPSNTPTDPNNAGQVADFARLARRGGGSYNWPAYFEDGGNAPEVYLVDPNKVPFVPVKFRCYGGATSWWNYSAAEFENYINNAYPGKYGVPIPPEVKTTNNSGGAADSPIAIYDYVNDIQFNFWFFHSEGNNRFACWAGHSGGTYVGIKEPAKCSPGSTPAKFSQGNGTYCWPFGEDTAGFTDLGSNITLDDYYSGDINHAVAISIAHVKSDGFSYPATRFNGWCQGGNNQGASSYANCLYVGQRLRLPANYDTSQIQDKNARILAEAVKKYGFIIHDTSGGIGIQSESSISVTANGKPNPWDLYFGGAAGRSATIQAFPWESLQVLPKDYRW